MNRCVKCESGRAGTCPWISRFQAPEAEAVPGDKAKAQNHEDRALLLHENAGSPCANQITLDDFIDQIDSFTREAILPATEEELLDTLSSFEEFLSRLRRLTKTFRPVFTDITLAAIEHALAHIDFSFLKKGLEIQTLIHNIHPAYNRADMFIRCGFPSYLVQKYQAKARSYKEADAPIVPKEEDPVAVTASNLPPELSTPPAMLLWHKAQQAGLVDEQYRFTGKHKNELAVFAASFSIELFKEIRWAPFNQWEPYKHYVKTYSAYSAAPPKKETDTMKRIKALFNL